MQKKITFELEKKEERIQASTIGIHGQVSCASILIQFKALKNHEAYKEGKNNVIPKGVSK